MQVDIANFQAYSQSDAAPIEKAYEGSGIAGRKSRITPKVTHVLAYAVQVHSPQGTNMASQVCLHLNNRSIHVRRVTAQRTATARVRWFDSAANRFWYCCSLQSSIPAPHIDGSHLICITHAACIGRLMWYPACVPVRMACRVVCNCQEYHGSVQCTVYVDAPLTTM